MLALTYFAQAINFSYFSPFNAVSASRSYSSHFEITDYFSLTSVKTH